MMENPAIVGWSPAGSVDHRPLSAPEAAQTRASDLPKRPNGANLTFKTGIIWRIPNNWHRHYDATLGRYVQPDPIGYAGGRSLYGYVGQSPLAYVDRDGQFGLYGAATSFLADYTIQAGKNYFAEGLSPQDSILCVNVAHLAAATAFGFFGPTLGDAATNGFFAYIFAQKVAADWGGSLFLKRVFPETVGELFGGKCSCPRK